MSVFRARPRRGGASLAQRLLGAGLIVSPTLVFSRAQTGGALSTRQRADGVWEEVAADVPRRHGVRQLLLIEPQRTNTHANPRMEPTSGSGLPTSYVTAAPDAGLTYTYAAQSSMLGVQGRAVRIHGTAAGSDTRPLHFPTAVPAASQKAGDVWSLSRFGAFVSGSYAGLTAGPRLRVAGGVSTAVSAQIPDTGQLVRMVLFQTSAATPASLLQQLHYMYSNGAELDVEMFAGWDQAEFGAFATTPILPPIESPGAATRGADNATAAIAAISTAGAFSLALGFELPALPPSGDSFTVLSANDGSVNNQLRLRVSSAGALIPSHVIGGVATDLPSLGTLTAGNTRWRAGLSWQPGTGTFRALLHGGGDQTGTGLTALTGVLSTLRLGAGPGGIHAGGLLFADADSYPATLIGAGLPDAVAALPLP